MSFLEPIMKQSPWLAEAFAIETDIHLVRLNAFKYIYRETAFLNYAFEDGVYVVTGPRQIGKSTHLKMLVQQKITEINHQDFLYFNCDLLDTKKDIVELIEEYTRSVLK